MSYLSARRSSEIFQNRDVLTGNMRYKGDESNSSDTNNSSTESDDIDSTSEEDYFSTKLQSKVDNNPLSYNNIKGTIYDFSMKDNMRGMWYIILFDVVVADESDEIESLFLLSQFSRLKDLLFC